MTDPSSIEIVDGALQHSIAQEDDLEGGLVVGWVVVAECATPDGARWISRMASPSSTTWQLQGYLHNALNDWPVVEVEDEE